MSAAVELLTVKEVQEKLRVCRSSVDKLIQQGVLHSIRVGRSIRVPVHSLDAFITTRTAHAPQAS